jgi:hypothetical protein
MCPKKQFENHHLILRAMSGTLAFLVLKNEKKLFLRLLFIK